MFATPVQEAATNPLTRGEQPLTGAEATMAPGPGRGSVAHILMLQRTVGNRAALRFLGEQRDGSVALEHGEVKAVDLQSPHGRDQMASGAPSGRNQAAQAVRPLPALRRSREMQRQVKGAQQPSNPRAAGMTTETVLSGKPAALLGTAALLQTIIQSSKLLAPYVKDAAGKARRVPAIFKLDSSEEFQEAMKQAGISLKQPSSGSPPGLREERTQAVREVGGFYDSARDEIHMPEGTHFGRALHEVIHSYSKHTESGKIYMCQYLNEGFTQYLADEVLKEKGLTAMEDIGYGPNVESAKKLIDAFRFEAVAGLYFLGHGGHGSEKLVQAAMKGPDC